MFKGYPLQIFLIIFFYAPSLRAQEGAKPKHMLEKLELRVDTSHNLLTPALLTVQSAPSFNERNGKGIFLPILAGYAITKGGQAIQKMISDRKSRYISQYNFAQRDHYFYDQISTNSSLDPAGIQFKGFTIVRLQNSKNAGGADTLLMAKFIIDTTEGKCAE